MANLKSFKTVVLEVIKTQPEKFVEVLDQELSIFAKQNVLNGVTKTMNANQVEIPFDMDKVDSTKDLGEDARYCACI